LVFHLSGIEVETQRIPDFRLAESYVRSVTPASNVDFLSFIKRYAIASRLGTEKAGETRVSITILELNTWFG